LTTLHSNNDCRCPIDTTLDVIGGKWKLRILYHLSESVLRFGELQKKMPGITQKMLTQQLRELEQDGMIVRKVYAEVPPKVEYSVSDYGRTIQPALETMASWGTEHIKRQGPCG